MSQEIEKPYELKGKQAIRLWKQGKDAWNEWVEQHPEANINFRGEDFGQYRNDPGCHISPDKWPFAGFHFPKGTVNFLIAKFGDGRVNFSGVRFGEGDVDFRDAKFGEGGGGGLRGRQLWQGGCELPGHHLWRGGMV